MGIRSPVRRARPPPARGYFALLRKLTYIARKNHRSLNAQLEHLAQQCVDEYEEEHGTIEFPPEE